MSGHRESFRLRSGSRRAAKPGPKPPSLLARANTVASGLGQRAAAATASANGELTPDRRLGEAGKVRSAGSGEMASCSASTSVTASPAGKKPDEAFRNFCRGSLKRLKRAESKISVAKRDMEEIIELAKSETDITSTSRSPAKRRDSPLGVDAAFRLAEDSRLAIEAEQEMCNIVFQFAHLLQEEEERMVLKAEDLQRRSSQVHFDLAAAAAVAAAAANGDAAARSSSSSSSGSGDERGGDFEAESDDNQEEGEDGEEAPRAEDKLLLSSS